MSEAADEKTDRRAAASPVKTENKDVTADVGVVNIDAVDNHGYVTATVDEIKLADNNRTRDIAEENAATDNAPADSEYDRMYINPIFQRQSTTAHGDDDYDDDIENVGFLNEEALHEGILQSIGTRPGSVERVRYIFDETPADLDEDSSVQVVDPDPEPRRPLEPIDVVAVVDGEMVINVPWYRQIRTWLIIFVLSVSVLLVAIFLTQTDGSEDNESTVSDGNINSINDTSPTPSVAPVTSSPTTFMDRQYAALKQLYSETGGSASWKNADGWSEPSSASYTSCDWFGVSCNYKSEVTDIELSNNGLVGDISLIGAIFLQIPTLQYIDLRSNGLTGDMHVFSESMAQLPAMKYLDLRFNDLEGSVPSELCVALSQANILIDCLVECSCCAHEDLCECSNTSDWVSVEFGLGCNGFEQPQFRCELLDASGMSGAEACCSCGGGNRVNPIPSTSPSYLATISPSLRPTSMPSISVEPSLSMSPSEGPISTRDILIAFYNDLNGDNWRINTDWLSPTVPECHWWGIVCVGDVITYIDIFEPNNMVGSITSTIGMLSTLKFIRLNENPIASSIPSEIANLKSLTDLSLKSNSFTSSIPTELFLSAHRLEFLDLSKNADLTGTLPSELGMLQSLKNLLLYETGLGGTIPTEFGMLESMQNMYLKYNSVSGTIPTEVGKLSSMTIFDFRSNSVGGTIPSELGKLSSMTVFELCYNSVGGTIPTEFGKLTSLVYLSLQDNLLTGTLPTELGMMGELSYFLLFDNIITGTLPTEVGVLSKSLRVLDIHSNSVSGPIPTEVGLLFSLRWLVIWANRLTGTIPTEIGLLNNCKLIDIQHNSLIGTLPTEIGMLASLEYFFTGSNSNLYGSIPNELGNTSLRFFIIANEQISGTIPSELGNLSQTARNMYLYNNQLSGTIPSELTFSFTKLERLRMEGNNLTGTIPTELGVSSINMKVLDLSSNSLYGNVPSELGRLTRLISLFVYDNDLTGVMPQEVCIRAAFRLKDLTADCAVEVECECCSECCTDGAGCDPNI